MLRLSLPVLAAAAAVAVVAPLRAQAPTSPAPAPVVCDSLLFHSPVATVTDTLRLRLRAAAGMPALPRGWAEVALDAIASRFRVPRPLMLDVYEEGQPPLPPPLPMEIEPTLFDEVRLVLQRDGRLVAADLIARSLVDPVDVALLGAIRAADSLRALPAFPQPTPPTAMGSAATPAAGPSDSVVVFVNLTRASLPPALGELAAAPSRDVAQLTLPRLRGAEPMRPRPGAGGPRYPAEDRTAGREGRAVLQFVVDQSGAVADGTVSVLSFSAVSFAAAALEFVPRARFVPASLGGCPIRQIVQQPFEFRLFLGAPPKP